MESAKDQRIVVMGATNRPCESYVCGFGSLLQCAIQNGDEIRALLAVFIVLE